LTKKKKNAILREMIEVFEMIKFSTAVKRRRARCEQALEK